MGAPVQKQPVKSDKKLKGCVQSEGGKYLLKQEHGKTIALGGSQDLPSHVGHTVTVHGNYMSNAATESAAMSDGVSKSAGAFMVSKIDMVADVCSAGKGDKGAKESDNGKPSAGHK
jgi:hypothetical protein